MKKIATVLLLFLMLIGLTAMYVHKFYVAVYQMDYSPEKKALHITSRIFIDDFNAALGKKYKKKYYLGTSKESNEEVLAMQQYLLEKLAVKINGQEKNIRYLGKEMEDDVLICYYSIKDVEQPRTLDVKCTLLLDYISEQQNIIHANVAGVRKSLLLTEDTTKGSLKF